MAKGSGGYSIGKVSEIVGIKDSTLRFWEKEIPILAPKKSSTGRRKYTDKDIEVILYLKNLLYEQGFTIEGAKKKIESEKADHHSFENKPDKILQPSFLDRDMNNVKIKQNQKIFEDKTINSNEIQELKNKFDNMTQVITKTITDLKSILNDL